MKTIYLLEVNCDYVGAYDTREKAMIEGLSRYMNWLEGYAIANDHEYSNREIVGDLQDFITHNYIEDYIYITEVPYYGE